MSKRVIQTLIERLYGEKFGEDFQIPSEDMSELKNQQPLLGKEENNLREFFGHISKIQPPIISTHLANTWRDDLFKELEAIQATTKEMEKKHIREEYLKKLKLFFFSHKMSFSTAAALCVIFFTSGMLLKTIELNSSGKQIKTSNDFFLPGSQIEQIHFIRKPILNSSEVSFILKTITPVIIEGSTQDELVRDAISKTLLSSCSPSIKLECLSIISGCETLIKQSEIRKGLLFALKNDYNPKVRLKVMEMLVKDGFDSEFQRMLVDVIQNDESSSIRAAAAELMTNKLRSQKSIKLDGNIQNELSIHLQNEPDRYIRNQISQILFSN